jgi:S-adenosylhomocysteine hydrolase
MLVKPRDGYSFAFKLIAMIWLTKHAKDLKLAGYKFPKELDKETAMLKLETMCISEDEVFDSHQ